MTVEENLAGGEVRYVDRHDGGLKTEAIYGERGLRWVYGNPLGRLTQWLRPSTCGVVCDQSCTGRPKVIPV